MAQKASKWEDALAIALSLSVKDRLKLVERIVSSVEGEIPGTKESVESQSGHWGAEVVALLNQLDLSEWEQMDMPDVAAWVREQRRKQSDRHAHNWEETS